MSEENQEPKDDELERAYIQPVLEYLKAKFEREFEEWAKLNEHLRSD